MPQQTGRKVLIYFPEGEDIDALFDKVAALMEKRKGEKYRPYGKARYTMSNVMLDALKELETQYEQEQTLEED